MVPRAEVEAVDQTTSLGRLLEIFEESGPFPNAGLCRKSR
jgi:CBS domain containing-hemolysin-like protein